MTSDIQPTTRLLAMPTDTNAAGDIFGGWIMSQVDIAGAICAFQHASKRVVTVAVNAFQFRQPVYVGDIVSCYTRVAKVGNTSITVEVEVFAERARNPDDRHKVTEASLTYVALDEAGRPTAVGA